MDCSCCLNVVMFFNVSSKMDEHRIEELSKLKFVQKMGALSDRTFQQVYETNQEFVDFTRESMSQGKGIFKLWIEYCKLRQIPRHA